MSFFSSLQQYVTSGVAGLGLGSRRFSLSRQDSNEDKSGSGAGSGGNASGGASLSGANSTNATGAAHVHGLIIGEQNCVSLLSKYHKHNLQKSMQLVAFPDDIGTIGRTHCVCGAVTSMDVGAPKMGLTVNEVRTKNMLSTRKGAEHRRLL